MKPVMRTTIILDEDLRTRLKLLSASKGMTMKEILTAAIDRWIKENSDGGSRPVHERKGESRIAARIIDDIQAIVGLAPAKMILAQKCLRFGIDMKSMGRRDISLDFINALSDSVGYLSDDGGAATLRRKLLAIAKTDVRRC